jgi:hypothetical protein
MAKRKSISDPERVSFTIDTELFDPLQLYAIQNCLTMSDVIREACELFRNVYIGLPEDQAHEEAIIAKVKAEQAIQELPSIEHAQGAFVPCVPRAALLH